MCLLTRFHTSYVVDDQSHRRVPDVTFGTTFFKSFLTGSIPQIKVHLYISNKTITGNWKINKVYCKILTVRSLSVISLETISIPTVAWHDSSKLSFMNLVKIDVFPT